MLSSHGPTLAGVSLCVVGGGRGWRSSGLDHHALTLFQRIRRVDDDGILQREPLEYLYAGTKIPADGEPMETDAVVRAYDRRHRPLRPEQQRIDGQAEPFSRRLRRKVQLGISSRH